jgi:oligoribonuclease NrnB/cAMP/cGMP phosphodiesterase (DHH superfamily)
MNIKFDTIIYHKCCPDGVSGLWCAHHYNQIDFEKISMKAGVDPEFDTTNKDIIFIDVCPSFNFLLVHTKLAKSIKVLDHHKSAYDTYIKNKEFLDSIDNLEMIFDMNRSGAQMAWDFFFGNQPRSWFINYVGDRDLWKWELPNSKEISAAFDFNNYFMNEDLFELDLLSKYDKNQINELIKIGSTINEYQQKLIKNEVDYSCEASIKVEDKTYYVRIGHIIGGMVSDLGNKLSLEPLSSGELPDFGVVWNYNIDTQTWYVSLRGHDTSPDLSIIAKHFGGGGHAKASAIRIEAPNNLLSLFTIQNN